MYQKKELKYFYFFINNLCDLLGCNLANLADFLNRISRSHTCGIITSKLVTIRAGRLSRHVFICILVTFGRFCFTSGVAAVVILGATYLVVNPSASNETTSRTRHLNASNCTMSCLNVTTIEYKSLCNPWTAHENVMLSSTP
jgi:hypothetical protein